jgi:hypothetical protein
MKVILQRRASLGGLRAPVAWRDWATGACKVFRAAGRPSAALCESQC